MPDSNETNAQTGRRNRPKDASPVESILCNDELNRRPSRPPDYEAENRALVTLAQALADSPETILQSLADTILDVLHPVPPASAF